MQDESYIVKVSVVGLGYVGSVAAAGLAAAGHDVLGIDVDAGKVEAYRRDTIPGYEPGLSDLVHEALTRGKLQFMHTDEVAESLGEVVLLTTGTPVTEEGTVDLSQVESALFWIKGKQPRESVITMKSTVPPGTGVHLVETVLRDTCLKCVSNPEFLREGQAVQDWFHPDRIVIGGADDQAMNVIEALYDGIEAPQMITDITSAEMIKYASNAFLATKISFINEIAALCDRLGATIDDVSRGIALDPRISSSFLGAGMGYGGSCFPKDVRALDQLASTNNHDFELLRSVITVNNRQRLLPLYALRERFGPLSGVRVSVLGVAFKPNTDDVREAPSLDLIRALVGEGAQVSAFDPKAMPAARSVVPTSVHLASDPLECADSAQAIVLVTEWPEIVNADWEEIAGRSRPPRFLFDGRNALDPRRMRAYGFDYRGVGRAKVRSAGDRLQAGIQ